MCRGRLWALAPKCRWLESLGWNLHRAGGTLAFQPVSFFFKYHQRVILVRSYRTQINLYPEPERNPQIQCAAEQHSSLGRLRGVEPVQRAVITPSAAVRRIMAESGIAQLISAQGPVNQESQGGLIGPLPAGQFGSAVSWKEASSASMAAFTATA